MSTKHQPKPAIKKAPGAGVHPFAKKPTAVKSTPIRGEDSRPVPDLVESPRTQFQARLPTDLLRDLRVHAAMTERKLQDVTEQALREYLERNS